MLRWRCRLDIPLPYPYLTPPYPCPHRPNIHTQATPFHAAPYPTGPIRGKPRASLPQRAMPYPVAVLSPEQQSPSYIPVRPRTVTSGSACGMYDGLCWQKENRLLSVLGRNTTASITQVRKMRNIIQSPHPCYIPPRQPLRSAPRGAMAAQSVNWPDSRQRSAPQHAPPATVAGPGAVAFGH